MKIPEWLVYTLVWGIGGLCMFFIMFYTQMAKNKTPKKELYYDKKTKTYYEKENKKWNGLNQEQDSLQLQ